MTAATMEDNLTMENNLMKGFKFFVLVAVAVFCCAVVTPTTQAQVSVDIGVAPVCPYGYYDVPPYSCAPYGYYGPEWFNGGLCDFHGGVDNRFDPHQWLHGPLPQHGDKPFNHFRNTAACFAFAYSKPLS